MKKIFYASFISVLTGVVLLGVNAAFGANTPSVAPENADLVSPVFGGADIRGKIRNTSGVDGPGGDGAVIIDDDLGVQNNLIIGKEGLFAGKLQAAAGLEIGVSGLGNLLTINKGKISSDGAVVIGSGNKPADFIDQNGDIDIAGILNAWGPIKNSGGNIGDSGGKVKIDDEVVVTGSADMIGGITNSKVVVEGVSSTPQPVTINDDLQVNEILKVFKDTYLTKAVNIGGNISAQLKLDVAGQAHAWGGLIVNNGLTVSGAGDFADGVSVTGSITNPNPLVPVTIGNDLDILGAMSTTGNAYFNGTVVAEKFGNYTKRLGNWFNVLANATGTNTSACLAGETVISCGVDVWQNIEDIELNEIDLDDATASCTVTATNKSANGRWFRSSALCFLPGL